MKQKRVPDHVKSAIKHYAANSDLTQKRIAELTGTSERSVYRVLQEAGLLKHMPRMTPELIKALAALKDFNLLPRDVPAFLENLHILGVVVFKSIDEPTKFTVKVPYDAYSITRGMILKAITEMEDGTWAALLKDSVTARVAKSHNVGVSTAMLNLQNAVDKNAKPGNN